MGSNHSYQKISNTLMLEDLFKIDDNIYMDPITRKLYHSNLEPMKTFKIEGISNPLIILQDINGLVTIRVEETVKNYGSKLYIESIKQK